MKPARLLALSSSFPLRAGSPSGVFVQKLYEHLPRSWVVEIVCPADDLPCEVEATDIQQRLRLRPVRYAPRSWQVLAQKSGGLASGLRARRLRIVLVPLLLLALGWACLRAARKAQLIHANWAICGAVAAPAAKLLRRPLVTTLRGDDVTRTDHSRIDRWLLRLAVNASAAVTCVSPAIANQLRERFPERKQDIHVCLNGVDDMFLKVPRAKRVAGPIRICSVGSLIRRKGFDVLLDALARMPDGDGVRLRIAGDGPERTKLSVQAQRLGVLERVEFVGEIEPDRVPDFLAKADLFVLASRSEGRPNAVIEALAAALPVVSTDLPGVDGLVVPGTHGWIVPVDDPTAMAFALQEAADSPEILDRMGAAARESISAAGHDWAACAASYDAVFRRALADSRQGRE